MAGACNPGALTNIRHHNRVGIGAADREFEAGVLDPPRQYRGAQHDEGTRGLGIALVAEHQRVAVDDPGRRRTECGGAAQRRFETLGGCATQPFEVVDAVLPCRRRDRFEAIEFGFVGGDDQFAEPRVRYAALAAIGVEELAALNTPLHLEASRRVIDPAVDHLAVA